MIRIQATQVVMALMVCCHLWLASMAFSQAGPDWLPMFGLDPDCQDTALDLYLYDMDSGNLRIVKQNCNRTYSFGSMNESRSKMVYGERETITPQRQTYIRVYDVAMGSSTTIRTLSDADPVAFFDGSDMIVFNGDDGTIKRMNPTGDDVITLVVPQYPYRLGMFWMSPDRQKIVAIENERGVDYETSNYERLVLFDADGSDRQVLVDRYLGEWNFVGWKPDSSAFIYYYHTFNGQPIPDHTKDPHYVTLDLSEDPFVRTDLSSSYLGGREGNVCLYTRSGNLLGISTGELYNASSGSFLVDCSDDVIPPGEGILGIGPSRRIYFARRDGTQFHEFPECQYLVAGAGHVRCDMNWDGIVSIVGDVPPFVRVVYFQDYSGYDDQFPCKDPVLPGDCNNDGILSIVGDVPEFVNRVYFQSN